MNMTIESPIGNNKKTARIAGALYLFFIIATAIANVSRTKLIVPGDAITTAQNIQASEGFFRIGFFSDILAGILFLLAAWALYTLLKQLNKLSRKLF